MKWLEVIQIRTAQNRSDSLVGELTAMLSDLRKKSDGPIGYLYRHAAIPTDFSLHLLHETGSGPPVKSKTGLLLSSVAKDIGMVNHTVWVLENSENQPIGGKDG